jgi:hypothetical protein
VQVEAGFWRRDSRSDQMCTALVPRRFENGSHHMASWRLFAPLPYVNRLLLSEHKGTVYLHNRSGARKSSGSYFTKPFAVEHLLNDALTPALDEHVAHIAAFARGWERCGCCRSLLRLQVR